MASEVGRRNDHGDPTRRRDPDAVGRPPVAQVDPIGTVVVEPVTYEEAVAPLGAPGCAGGGGGGGGRAQERGEPVPAREPPQTRPPCASTMWRAIASPRPVPPSPRA